MTTRIACAVALFVLACQGDVIDDTRHTTAIGEDAGTSGCPPSAPLDPATGECSAAEWPDPPPYCVAPCVWAAVKKCLPVQRTCVSQVVDSIFDGSEVEVHCQPDSGWESRAGWVGGSGRQPHTMRTISTSEGVCYAGTMGFDFFDRNLGGVALETSGTVLCATIDELMRRVATRLPDGGFSLDGLDQYVLDRSRPECDAWDDWGFPRAPCAVTTPGSCDATLSSDGGL